jgi:transposase
MSGNKQRRFTDEFKGEAVRLIETSGRNVQQVANDLCISKSTLSQWRSAHEHGDLLEGPHEDVTKELARLRKENEILRQEREILTKAAAFFAKEGSR